MAEKSTLSRRDEDIAVLLSRLAALAREHQVPTLVLRAPATLSWLLGARWNVASTLDAACLDVIVDVSERPSLTVVTNAIEAPRLAETELAGLSIDWQVLPWWAARDGALPSGPGVGSDVTGDGCKDLSGAIAQLRRRLTDRQAATLRSVCRDASAAVSAVAARLAPGDSEYAAAGLMSAELLARELEPVCLFVAGGERMGQHRHPLPTSGLLGSRASLVCCARRHGLIASVTRIICFGPPPGIERYRALLEVEASFLDATRVGSRLGDVVTAGINAYAAQGFSSDEWTRHHQGGLSGWQPREFPAHPSSDLVLQPNTVVAWNPSGDSWKVEDTCLLGPDGVQPLVADPAWPTCQVAGRERPDLLII